MAKEFDSVRLTVMEKVKEALCEYDVLRTGSQEYAIPVVNDDHEEGYIVISFKVPKGTRDGEPYDGYEVAKDYQFKCEEKERKALERAKEKRKKIERDKKMREARKQKKEVAE